MEKDNLVYLRHIYDAIDRIEDYTKDIEQTQFKENKMMQAAVIREIEIIGEASKRITEEFKKQHPKVPWKQMAGMRNKVIHDYFGVDIEIVWNTLKKDIPNLKLQFKSILKK
ncbi:MAG: DUF86 domain-containing protein [bacterium]|nr:DUF86 domain-containing protein [bacterium]